MKNPFVIQIYSLVDLDAIKMERAGMKVIYLFGWNLNKHFFFFQTFPFFTLLIYAAG